MLFDSLLSRLRNETELQVSGVKAYIKEAPNNWEVEVAEMIDGERRVFLIAKATNRLAAECVAAAAMASVLMSDQSAK